MRPGCARTRTPHTASVPVADPGRCSWQSPRRVPGCNGDSRHIPVTIQWCLSGISTLEHPHRTRINTETHEGRNSSCSSLVHSHECSTPCTDDFEGLSARPESHSTPKTFRDRRGVTADHELSRRSTGLGPSCRRARCRSARHAADTGIHGKTQSHRPDTIQINRQTSLPDMATHGACAYPGGSHCTAEHGPQ